MKLCRKCGETKPEEAFRIKKSTGNVTSPCKVCLAATNKRRYDGSEEVRQRHHAGVRVRKLMREYGLTVEAHQQMFRDQEGRCAICNIEPSSILHVDHDHVTGDVRGLLCNNCNWALGLFKDDSAVIRSAADYLDHGTFRIRAEV